MLSQSKEVEDFPQRNLWSDCNHVPKLSFLNTKELLCVPFNADILMPSLVIWHRSNEETCTTGRSPRKTQGEGRAYRILPPKSGGSVLSLDVIRPTHAVNARHRAMSVTSTEKRRSVQTRTEFILMEVSRKQLGHELNFWHETPETTDGLERPPFLEQKTHKKTKNKREESFETPRNGR